MWELSRGDAAAARRCSPDYDGEAAGDPIAAHISRLCKAVRLLQRDQQRNQSQTGAATAAATSSSLRAWAPAPAPLSPGSVTIHDIFALYMKSVLGLPDKRQAAIAELMPCTCGSTATVVGFKIMEGWFGRPWKKDRKTGKVVEAWRGGFFNTEGHDFTFDGTVFKKVGFDKKTCNSSAVTVYACFLLLLGLYDVSCHSSWHGHVCCF